MTKQFHAELAARDDIIANLTETAADLTEDLDNLQDHIETKSEEQNLWKETILAAINETNSNFDQAEDERNLNAAQIDALLGIYNLINKQTTTTTISPTALPIITGVVIEQPIAMNINERTQTLSFAPAIINTMTSAPVTTGSGGATTTEGTALPGTGTTVSGGTTGSSGTTGTGGTATATVSGGTTGTGGTATPKLQHNLTLA